MLTTVSWGLENTFDFCFNGIEKGSVVAVSTYMVSESDHHKDQKEFFLKGYNEMLKRLEPKLVICYNEPFPEMEGNILHIDYELSSWMHYADDECKSDDGKDAIAKKLIGYVCKGMGSAHGGEWKPSPNKPNDKKFYGAPNTIAEFTLTNGKIVFVKYDASSRAVLERHFEHHGNPSLHSIPHDHIIDWSKGHPDPGPPINYYDGNAPEFKSHTRSVIMNSNEIGKFLSLSEFEFDVSTGRDIEFSWNGILYFTRKFPKKADGQQDAMCNEYNYYICEQNNEKSGRWYDTTDDLLNHIVQGKKLREIITEVSIVFM